MAGGATKGTCSQNPVVGVHRLAVLGVVAAVTLVAACERGGGPVSESGVTEVLLQEREELGTFDGVTFERLVGQVEGRVHRSEAVVGLKEFLGDREFHTYRSEFELLRPADGQRGDLVVVEVENRGSPVLLQFLNRFVIGLSGAPSETTYPEGLGDGFLFRRGWSYARVQWQSGITPGVPETAQGVGEVIVRDFGRLLDSGRQGDTPSPLGRYLRSVLIGVSQAGWFIDTFVAEGFNPDRRGQPVYDGALTVASAGNWLAINQLGDDQRPQQPYVRPDGRPLPASQILIRPQTDPYFVDVVTYTDFYRLRAALSRDPDPPGRSRRYSWPAPHLPSFFVDEEFVFDTLGCNEGEVVPLSPTDYRPYLRALLVGLEGELGFSERRLPPSSGFDLGDQPPDSQYFNDLAGAHVPVPEVDGDGQPRGGTRFPDVEVPLGRPEPAALPPVTTSEMAAICGNFGGYHPFAASELEDRYGTIDDYEARVADIVDHLVADGLLLPGDREWVISDLRHRFATAPQS